MTRYLRRRSFMRGDKPTVADEAWERLSAQHYDAEANGLHNFNE